ncbi:MAG: insulinase family protein [Chloroflexi bacterium]|nr:insulinase family protein [Chloroflexota bacterium]
MPQNNLIPAPKHEKTKLPGGLRVLTSTMPTTNAVSLVVHFGAGSRYESDELAGSSHLFEHLLFKGTTKRPEPRLISEVVEGVGGVLNAYTDRELTGYWARVPRPHYVEGLDVLVDMIRNPLFRPSDIDREKNVVFEEIRASNDAPSSRVDTILDQLMWPNQPMGRDIAGSEESVGAVSRDALMEYMRTQYVPVNTVVAVAGGVTHKEVMDQVSRLMGDWDGSSPVKFAPVIENFEGPAVKIEYRKTEQAHVAMAMHGISLHDPDRYALRLLSAALGESMSSRLFEEVREKRGLAYDIHSGASMYSDCGALNVSSGVDPKRALDAVKVVVAELVKLLDGIPDDELNKAKELSKGRLILRMEESRSVASSIGVQELVKGEVETVDDMIAGFNGVTVDDVRRVARRVVKPNRIALAVVGPFRSEARFLQALKF